MAFIGIAHILTCCLFSQATVALALKTLETESSIVIFSVFVEVVRIFFLQGGWNRFCIHVFVSHVKFKSVVSINKRGDKKQWLGM